MARKYLFQSLLKAIRPGGEREDRYQETFAQMGRVVSDPRRCVQCGVCNYNCPIGIPVREYAQRGLPVENAGCITCGQCILVCPRGTLRWETGSHSLGVEHLADTAVQEFIVIRQFNEQ